MLMALNIPLIPDALQRCEVFRFICGELSRFLQHGFTNLLAVVNDSVGIYLQRFEQDIFLGVHDAQKVLQALAVMVGGVYMNMNAAGVVDLGPGMAHLTDAFLQLGQFCIGELGSYHFHAVSIIVNSLVAGFGFHLGINTAIRHKCPILPSRVLNFPFIVVTACAAWGRAEIVCQGPRCLLTGNAGHLHLNAEALILYPNHAAAPPFNSSSTARMRRAMASMTCTVTLLPACL